MDGWNTILSYWVKRPILRGKKLVSGRVPKFVICEVNTQFYFTYKGEVYYRNITYYF